MHQTNTITEQNWEIHMSNSDSKIGCLKSIRIMGMKVKMFLGAQIYGEAETTEKIFKGVAWD